MSTLNIFIRSSLCFIFVFIPLANLDQWFYDQFLNWRGKSSYETDLVVMPLSEDALKAFVNDGTVRNMEAWPPLVTQASPTWTENVHGRLIAEINQAKPRLVVVSTYFGATERTKVDPNTQHVVFSSRLNDQTELLPPFGGQLEEHTYGYNNFFTDADNTVRSSPLSQATSVSLALRTYHQLVDEPLERDLLKPVWLEFRGRAGSFPTVDAIEFLKDPDRFRQQLTGKIIIIGHVTHQLFETPVGPMSGPELHANIIDANIRGREIHRAPEWLKYIIASISILLSVNLILTLPLKLGWVSVLVFGTTILGMSFFMLSVWGVWIGVANAVVSIFGTHLLILGFKLGREEEQQWRIIKQAEQLREMDQFKNNFISLFSHDLKTPISKIKAIITRTRNEHQIPAEIDASFSAIGKTTDELGRLISDILKVTKMETMSLKPSKEVLDLNRLVEDSIQSVHHAATEKNISIEKDLEPLFSMEGDPKLLQEVITNLIENAVKYSPSDRKVFVKTEEVDSKVFLRVRDQGPGIPAEELPRITSKFYRGKQAAEKTKGSGLGLYLSKYFVEMHQGRLEIESTVGEGTEVRFWLPLAS